MAGGYLEGHSSIAYATGIQIGDCGCNGRIVARNVLDPGKAGRENLAAKNENAEKKE